MVPATGLAEVAGLREAVVVVVAELGVGGVTSGAFQSLVVLGSEPSFHVQRSRACQHVV